MSTSTHRHVSIDDETHLEAEPRHFGTSVVTVTVRTVFFEHKLEIVPTESDGQPAATIAVVTRQYTPCRYPVDQPQPVWACVIRVVSQGQRPVKRQTYRVDWRTFFELTMDVHSRYWRLKVTPSSENRCIKSAGRRCYWSAVVAARWCWRWLSAIQFWRSNIDYWPILAVFGIFYYSPP